MSTKNTVKTKIYRLLSLSQSVFHLFYYYLVFYPWLVYQLYHKVFFQVLTSLFLEYLVVLDQLGFTIIIKKNGKKKYKNAYLIFYEILPIPQPQE